jgi:hypothetical protein
LVEIILNKVQKDKSMGTYAGSAKIAEDFVAGEASVDIEKIEWPGRATGRERAQPRTDRPDGLTNSSMAQVL